MGPLLSFFHLCLLSELEVLQGGRLSPPWRFFLFWFGVLCRRASSPRLQRQMTWEGVGLVLWGMRTLLSHVELATGAVSSILRDSDLKKVDALSVEEALALLLQGTTFVCPSPLVDLFLYYSRLLIDSFLFFGKWLLTQRA